MQVTPDRSRPALKVLYIVSLFPCWSETFIVREIQGLIAQGVDVRILSLKPASQKLVHDDARALAERVIYTPSTLASIVPALLALLRAPVTNLRYLLTILWQLRRSPLSCAKSVVTWWRTLSVVDQLRHWQPSHIHAHWANYPTTSATILARNLGCAFGFTSHAGDIFLEDQLLALKFRECAYAVTISEFNIEFLAGILPACDAEQMRRKMRIVHHGIPVDLFAFDRRNKTPGRILAVGRLVEIKGFHHLVDACASLKQRGVDFYCEIIGDGPDAAALRAQLARHGLQQQLRLLGAQSQSVVRAKLLEASAFALPAIVDREGNRDGIPVALMEAMAVGTPVVSTRVSGIPELIQDRVNGRLLAPGDATVLADALAELLASPTQQQQFAEAARRTIEQHFNIATETEKMRQLMLEVGA